MKVKRIKQVKEEKTLEYHSDDKMRPIFELFNLEYDPCGTWCYRVDKVHKVCCGINFETRKDNAWLHVSQEGFIKIEIVQEDMFRTHEIKYYLEDYLKSFFVEMANGDIYELEFL